MEDSGNLLDSIYQFNSLNGKKDQKFIEKYISEHPDLILEFLNEKESIITAPFNSGKTYSTLNLCLEKGIKFVFAVPLTAIASQNILDLIKIEEYKKRLMVIMGKEVLSNQEEYFHKGFSKSTINIFLKNCEIKNLSPSFIVVYDSLPKLMASRFDPSDYILIIDEAHMLVTQMNFRDNAISRMINKKSKFKSVTYMTASPECIYCFETLPSLNFIRSVNYSYDVTLVHTGTEKNNLIHIFNIVRGLSFSRIVVYTNDTDNIIKLYQNFKAMGYSENELLILHSKTKDTPAYKILITERNFDDRVKIILTTKVIAEGANIDTPDVDYLILYNIDDLASRHQIIGRFREKSPKIIDVNNMSVSESYDFTLTELTNLSQNYRVNEDARIEYDKIAQDCDIPSPVNESNLRINFYALRKIYKVITSDSTLLENFYKKIVDASVKLISLEEYIVELGVESLTDEAEFEENSKIDWAKDEYFEENFSDLIFYKIRSEFKKYVFPNMIIDREIYESILRPKSIPTFDEYLLKKGLEFQKDKMEKLINLIFLGASLELLKFLVREQSIVNSFLEKANQYIEGYICGKVLQEEDLLRRFFANLPNESSENLLLKYQKEIVISRLIEKFNEKKVIAWRIISNEEKSDIFNYKNNRIPQIPARYSLLSLYKSTTGIKRGNYNYTNNNIIKQNLDDKINFEELLHFLKIGEHIRENDNPHKDLSESQINELKAFLSTESFEALMNPSVHLGTVITNLVNMETVMKQNYLRKLIYKMSDDFEGKEPLIYYRLNNYN